MHRRSILSLVILFISVTLHAEEVSKKPNFIVIFIDDLGYGSPNIRTPHIDRMADDISPLLTDPDNGVERESFLYLKKGIVIGARVGDWKYLPKGAPRYARFEGSPELFNVTIDIHERDHRVETEKSKVAQLAQFIDDYRKELGKTKLSIFL